MNNQNDNKSNALFAAIQIVLPLLLPILVPTFLIVGILFSIVLRLCKLSEEKLKELGFLGFTLSAVSTFLSFYVGYFWLADLNFTSVELSPHAVLIFAILCTLLLEGIFKVMDMFDSSDENKAHV
ncbi:epimerase [Bacillus thuringiensis]|uniref:epimerase n=1 Tax=Bacillus thuringiensis TaxID=1428 RepID=UPI0020D2817F|nr:epimerase [Bacillus thuringiensis]